MIKSQSELSTVHFYCNFGKAKVAIDDITRGTTPFETKISKGQHTLRAYLSGYKDVGIGLYIDGDRDFYINMFKEEQEKKPITTPPKKKPIGSQPKYYKVKFLCNAGKTEVAIDGTIQGTTPLSLNLKKGYHDIDAHLEGYMNYFDKFLVNKDQDYNIKMSTGEQEKEPITNPPPEKSTGPFILDHTVNFSCNVGAVSVAIDDNIWKTTPFSYKFKVGYHSIRVKLDGYEDYFDLFNVDRDLNYTIYMKKKEPGKEPSPTLPPKNPTKPKEFKILLHPNRQGQ